MTTVQGQQENYHIVGKVANYNNGNGNLNCRRRLRGEITGTYTNFPRLWNILHVEVLYVYSYADERCRNGAL